MLYITHKTKCIFIVNYKCGYTTFQNMVRNKQVATIPKITKFKNIPHIESKVKWFKNYTVIMITKNPFSRLLSMYFDKFVNRIKKGQYNLLCQTRMYKYYPLNYIKEGKFTFENFIDGIRKGYNDRHVRCQSLTIKKSLLNRIIILKMEDPDFSTKLQGWIGGGNIPHRNKTIKPDIVISEKDKNFIYKKYKSDFKNFNYDKEY